MKQIIITNSFGKVLKKYRKNFTEQHILKDIREFVRSGPRKGEVRLTTFTFGDISVDIFKLRIRVHDAAGRYLLGLIDNMEFFPIFIDLKTGYYGKNMSLDAERKVAAMLESAIMNSLDDYLEHTEKNPRLTAYSIE